jgi:alpha-1,3-mannosyltransferase
MAIKRLDLALIVLFLFDLILTALIIRRIPYTEIDWSTYLQQVHQICWQGEYDYSRIAGDSGPLVYPAGFVWIFAGFRMVCGDSIRAGQILFAAIYLRNLFVVCLIYRMAGVQSALVYIPLVLSRRIHSIYVLRMFNDCVAMLILYTSVLLFQKKKTKTASVFYSLAISVKMNILLFAPAVLLVLIKSSETCHDLVKLILLMGSVQLIVGLPFLLTHPISYVTRSFDLGRQFLYQWTVNWRFLGQHLFDMKLRGIILLALHIILVLLWFVKRSRSKMGRKEIFLWMAECNLVGIICARSLHYQFYSWYFHTIPFLLAQSKLPWPIR